MDNFIFNNYTPKGFCREYVEIKGNSSQLAMFMATVLGIKPLMDDWINAGRLKEFRKVCKQYGLKIREDVLFDSVPKSDLPVNILGRDFITTTSAYGYPVGSRQDIGVHVFISKNEALLKEGMWYPVIIKNRVIFQPRIDSLKYGYTLGYPECCIKFFRKFNNWLKYSYLYEVYSNTKGRPSFLCNPFLKDTSFSYIYHMPCSYDCKATVRLTSRLRTEIKRREPGYVDLVDGYLKKSFLAFYERKIYCFDGSLRNNEIKYKRFQFTTYTKKEYEDEYSGYFKQADTVKLLGRNIILSRGGKVIRQLELKWSSFAPEFPFMIQFS
ncbi:MAG: hypothetical protein PHN59_02470 [Candidatus Omnitrophica bacterium]|nr:hypothetical protein [Candidatus Omnitrophota bacterium]MDD5099100.1 hypothetical protein [Candidatus Colwellbacteria bacterium]MDD5506154.1 hypothetical protein [Candidatus Omnitrophota bacterium]